MSITVYVAAGCPYCAGLLGHERFTVGFGGRSSTLAELGIGAPGRSE